MSENKIREIIAESNEVEVRLQWAADLSLCLSVAVDSEVSADIASGALLALHEYLSQLHYRQEKNVDRLLPFLHGADNTEGGGGHGKHFETARS